MVTKKLDIFRILINKLFKARSYSIPSREHDTTLDEWQLTKDVILAIEGYDELLAENSYLKDSLNYRMPYFNILNYIQLELIKRQRRGELSADEERLIHTTINGIATGLRNSG